MAPPNSCLHRQTHLMLPKIVSRRNHFSTIFMTTQHNTTMLEIFINGNTRKFCGYLLTFMSFQTRMTYFLPLDTKAALLKNVHAVLLYSVWQHNTKQSYKTYRNQCSLASLIDIQHERVHTVCNWDLRVRLSVSNNFNLI